jgi:hypothetical protein
VCPGVHVVPDVVGEDALEPGDTEDDHVIEALTSDRVNDALDVDVLPRRSRSREDLVDLHRADGGHDVRERGIAVVQQVARRLVLGKGVAELLGRPCSRTCGEAAFATASMILPMTRA